jgi:hypothetical protein
MVVLYRVSPAQDIFRRHSLTSHITIIDEGGRIVRVFVHFEVVKGWVLLLLRE